MFEFLKKRNKKAFDFFIKPYEYIQEESKTYDIYFKDEYGKCKRLKDISMILISDTHGMLNKKNCINEDCFNEDCCLYNQLYQLIKKNLYDVIICLGDIRKEELKIICELNNSNKPIFGIKGNHDEINHFEDFPEIIDINNHMEDINGVKIIGIEGSIKYKEFNYPSYTQEDSLYLSEIMEKDADILISHARLYSDTDNNKSIYNIHVGLAGSLKYFLENKCSLNIHGHDHNNNIDDISNGGTSICIYGVKEIIVKDGIFL